MLSLLPEGAAKLNCVDGMTAEASYTNSIGDAALSAFHSERGPAPTSLFFEP